MHRTSRYFCGSTLAKILRSRKFYEVFHVCPISDVPEDFFFLSLSFRHGILHKPSASVKFWPKCFRKSSVIFGVLCITNYAWFSTFLKWQTVILGLARSTKYKIQLQTIWKLLQLYIQLAHLLPVSWKTLNHSFYVMENLYCTFHMWKIWQSTFHIVDTISVSSTKFFKPFNCGSFASIIFTFHIVYGFFVQLPLHIVIHM